MKILDASVYRRGFIRRVKEGRNSQGIEILLSLHRLPLGNRVLFDILPLHPLLLTPQDLGTGERHWHQCEEPTPFGKH